MNTTMQAGTCGKCDGRGRIDAFNGTANGVCFQCGGMGKLAYGSRAAGWTRAKLIARIADWFASPDMVRNWGEDAATAIADLICRAPVDVKHRALSALSVNLPSEVANEVARLVSAWRAGYESRGESIQ